MRALDNVIDLNFFPVPYAEINSRRYRLGFQVSGYHHMLAKHKIQWESEEHLKFAERVFSDIHYAALEASSKISEEKGYYPYFPGSDWQTGEYFRKRGLTKGRWKVLEDRIKKHGLRNGYLLAAAPASAQASSPAPRQVWILVMNRYFLEERNMG